MGSAVKLGTTNSLKIPFLDLKKIYQEQSVEIEAAVSRVLRSGWYLFGEECSSFESELKSDLVGSDEGFVIGCNSGTDALILSLLVLDIGAGDEVITVSHTAIPTVAAIVATGATPVFCDIDPDTLVMDVSKIKALINKKTKAIIPVHLYGNMVDIEALLLESGSEIPIIEDCAQAQGSRLRGKSAGTLGRFGTYSFYPSKNLGALGDGGAVFCKSEADLKKLKMLRFYGQESRYKAEVRRGLNSRLDEIQAAVLRVRLPLLQQWNNRKKEWVKAYLEILNGLPIQLQETTDGCDPAWHLFVVLLEDSVRRDSLMTFLKEDAVESLIHYPVPTHKQIPFQAFSNSALPVTESVASRVLSLPMNACSTKDEVSRVAHSIRNFFGQ